MSSADDGAGGVDRGRRPPRRRVPSIAACVLAGAGAGWALGRAEHRAEAALDVLRRGCALPLPGANAGAAEPMFDAFGASMATLARSRRVVDAVLADPGWGGRGDASTFSQHLAVRWSVERQRIEVAFRDADPARAQAGAELVTRHFARLVEEREEEPLRTRIAALEHEDARLTERLGRAEESGAGDDEDVRRTTERRDLVRMRLAQLRTEEAGSDRALSRIVPVPGIVRTSVGDDRPARAALGALFGLLVAVGITLTLRPRTPSGERAPR